MGWGVEAQQPPTWRLCQELLYEPDKTLAWGREKPEGGKSRKEDS